MPEQLFVAIAIGIAAGSFVFVALARKDRPTHMQRPLALAAYSIGAVVTWVLFKSHEVRDRLAHDITVNAGAVVLAALAAAFVYWRAKSWFR